MRNLPGSKHFSLTAYSSTGAFTASEAKVSGERIFVSDVAGSAKMAAEVTVYETDSAGSDTELFQQSVNDSKSINQSFNTPLIVSSDNYLKVSVTGVDSSSEARVNVSGFKA